MSTELDVLKDVTIRLEQAGVSYMLTGSMAMNYYAQPRMTRDIDIVVEFTLQNTSFAELFEPDYYVPTDAIEAAISTDGMFNLLHLESVVKIGFIVRKRELFREHEFARRRRIELPGFSTWIVSREDLILSKLVWARTSHSELQMGDIRNLLSSEADLDYLSDWAPKLGVLDLLHRALNERHQP